MTVIPGPPNFSLTVQLLDPFPCRVEFIKDKLQSIQSELEQARLARASAPFIISNVKMGYLSPISRNRDYSRNQSFASQSSRRMSGRAEIDTSGK